MADAPAFVLESFALLSYLQGEKNGVRIREIVQSAQSDSGRIYISLIDAGEVLSITERREVIQKAQDRWRFFDNCPSKSCLSTSKQSLLRPTSKQITPFPMQTLLLLLPHKPGVLQS